MTSNANEQQQRPSSRRSSGQARATGGLEGELRRCEPVPDELALAAVERAERHQQREGRGVLLGDIARHLGFVHEPWTTRRLRPQLEALTAAGEMSCDRRHGIVVWGLMSAGSRRLARARQAGEVGELPEAPQHRAWRHAHAAAGERIDGFREQMRRAVSEAAGLLDALDAGSDAWFAAAEKLHSACRLLGSAVYCLREWQEPNDARADVDDRCNPRDERLDPGERGRVRARRAGRRSIWEWPDTDSKGRPRPARSAERGG